MASWSDAWSGRSNDTLRLTVTQGSQNIGNNTTVVNWYLDIVEVNGTWTNDPTGSYSININGSVYSGTVPGYAKHTTTRIRSGSTTVTHNADGTKTINVSASASGVNILGSASIPAKGFTLSTIPRATTPSFSGGSSWDCGDAKTISLPRASSSFTHVVTYKFGSATGTISSSATTSVSWTPPLSLLAQIPNTTSGSGTLTVVTKNGSTTIGTKTASFTLKAPAEAKPSISSFTLSDNNSSVVSAIGQYVQGYSVLKGVIASSGYQGSTIKTATFKMGSASANSGGTLPITGSGTIAVTATVTDSRGRSTTSTQNISVLAYDKPTVTSWQARRSNASGTVENEGTYIRVDLTTSISSLLNGSTQKNSMVITVFTRERGTTNWGSAKRTINSTLSYSGTFVLPSSGGGTYLASDSYDILVTVTDKLDNSSVQKTIATASVFMHWSKTGVGIGKFHEQGRLDVAGDIYSSGKLISTGDVQSAATVRSQMGRFLGTGDVSPTSTTHGLQIGPDGGNRLVLDGNEIMSVNGSTPNDLNLQIEGGTVNVGNSATVMNVRGPLIEQLLPDPTARTGSTINTITATSWAAVPNMTTSVITVARACWVRVDFAAWMSAPSGDLRCGVKMTGATAVDPMDYPGDSNSVWGTVMWQQNGYEQRSGFKVVKLNAGSTTIYLQAYKSGSGAFSVNYPLIQVTPLRFA
ncbi:minor tail protein [Microbacterium phage Count]|nr:minor tail protein [Microbacterium phage Count]